MNRLIAAALVALALSPSLAWAVDITNIRACYGPLGAKRTDITCLPGDVFVVTYDIENLALDKKGKASYTSTFEFLDPQNKSLFKKDNTVDVVPPLGGARVPGYAHVIISAKQAPGLYTMRVTIEDKNGKDAKAFSQKVKVVEPAFGFVSLTSPAVGLVGFPYPHTIEFGLVNMTLDKKTKRADAKVLMRVYDDKGKEVRTPTEWNTATDLPEDADLEKAVLVPVRFQFSLNRPGRFTVELQGTDKLGKTTASLRFPLTVLDVAAFDK